MTVSGNNSVTDLRVESIMDTQNSSEGNSNSSPPLNRIYSCFIWLLFHGIFLMISIGFFFFDVGTDIAVAVLHYNDGKMWFFSLTVCFIVIPSLLINAFSLWWYKADANVKKLPPVSTTRWVFRIVFLSLQLGPILRYVDALHFGFKSTSNKCKIPVHEIYHKQMLYESADATLLRLFECFMEAAPQLVLQMFIFTTQENSRTGFFQKICMFASLLAIAWTLTSYQRALRYSIEDKKNMTLCGTVVMVAWHFFDIASRVLALGLFASVFPTYFFIVCGLHYAVMFTWIRRMKTSFFDNPFYEFLYNAALGVVFIFCYFNPKDSPTRFRYTFYYVFNFLENSILMCLWYSYHPTNSPYKQAMLIQFASFFLSLVIMIIYFVYVHPSQNISLWKHSIEFKSASISLKNGDAITDKDMDSSNFQENNIEVLEQVTS